MMLFQTMNRTERFFYLVEVEFAKDDKSSYVEHKRQRRLTNCHQCCNFFI